MGEQSVIMSSNNTGSLIMGDNVPICMNGASQIGSVASGEDEAKFSACLLIVLKMLQGFKKHSRKHSSFYKRLQFVLSESQWCLTLTENQLNYWVLKW